MNLLPNSLNPMRQQVSDQFDTTLSNDPSELPLEHVLNCGNLNGIEDCAHRINSVAIVVVHYPTDQSKVILLS